MKTKTKTFFRIYLVLTLISLNLILPIRILYMIDYNINNAEIGLLRTFFSICVFAFEVPAGVISDKISKKLAIILSCVFFSIHSIFYIIKPDFLGFLLTQLFLAISSALSSGTFSAYIYILLGDRADDLYTKTVGKFGFIQSIILLIISIFSSVIFNYNNNLNFIILTIFGILATIISIFLPDLDEKNIENGNSIVENNEKNLKESFVDFIIDNLKKIISETTILHILIYSIMMSILIFNFEYYQIILTNLNFDVKFNGLLYSSFTIISGLGYKYTHIIEKKLNYINISLIYIFLLSISYILTVFAKTYLILFFVIFIQQFIFGSWGLLLQSKIFLTSERNNISTLESISNAIFNLIKAIIIFLLSILSYRLNLNGIYIILFSICIFIMLIIVFYLIIKNKENRENNCRNKF